MVVDFKFGFNQKIKTTLGDEGIIDSIGLSSPIQKRYYIIFKGGAGAWLDEELIEGVE